jgi:S1-C subfamily serine protease
VSRPVWLFVLVVSVTLAAAAATAQDLRELSRTARESVMLLKVFDSGGQEVGAGTGFAVDGGLVVTNLHVIERAARVEAVLADNAAFSVVGVIASDPENDVAILRLDDTSLPPLPLATDLTVEPGERVVVLGNPMGLSGTLSEGIVSAVRDSGVDGQGRIGEGPPLLQITAAISPGSSGSPVMTLDGKVIGVAVSYYMGGQNLNFAVPIAAVADLLAKSNPRKLQRALAQSRPKGTVVYIRNLAISLVVFVAIFFGLRLLRDR